MRLKCRPGIVTAEMNSSISYLPPRLRDYARFPVKLTLCWIAFVAAIIWSPKIELPPAPDSSSSDASPAAYGGVADGSVAPDGVAASGNAPVGVSDAPLLYVSGGDPFRAMWDGSNLNIDMGELRGGKIAVDGAPNGGPTQAVVSQADGTRIATANSADPDEFVSLLDRGEIVSYLLRSDDDGFKLTTLSGTTLARIKIKDDEQKWNLYDPQGTRIMRGKLDGGDIVAKNANDSVVWRATFDHRIADVHGRLVLSALMALPIENQYRYALFAAHFRKYLS